MGKTMLKPVCIASDISCERAKMNVRGMECEILVRRSFGEKNAYGLIATEPGMGTKYSITIDDEAAKAMRLKWRKTGLPAVLEVAWDGRTFFTPNVKPKDWYELDAEIVRVRASAKVVGRMLDALEALLKKGALRHECADDLGGRLGEYAVNEVEQIRRLEEIAGRLGEEEVGERLAEPLCEFERMRAKQGFGALKILA